MTFTNTQGEPRHHWRHVRSGSIAVMLLALVANSLLAQSPPEVVLSGHEGAVVMGVFTPDGQRVVTASADQTARLWDAAQGTELRKYSQHTGPLSSIAVSADGRTLVTGSQDNTLRVWSLPLSQPIRRPMPLAASQAAG